MHFHVLLTSIYHQAIPTTTYKQTIFKQNTYYYMEISSNSYFTFCLASLYFPFRLCLFRSFVWNRTKKKLYPLSMFCLKLLFSSQQHEYNTVIISFHFIFFYTKLMLTAHDVIYKWVVQIASKIIEIEADLADSHMSYWWQLRVYKIIVASMTSSSGVDSFIIKNLSLCFYHCFEWS